MKKSTRIWWAIVMLVVLVAELVIPMSGVGNTPTARLVDGYSPQVIAAVEQAQEAAAVMSLLDILPIVFVATILLSAVGWVGKR